jgi:DNA polymerase I-like protein with 3'-5' exonuclease and polymerase domains
MARFDGGIYGLAVDEGVKDKGTDIHTLNQKSAGLPTRDDAKTFIYAFLYGAGDAKIGEIVKGTAEDGKRLKDSFFRKIPAIKTLVEQVALTYKASGTLKALDGNPFHIRAAHSALNTLLQGAGALVMKYYLVFADKELQKHFKVGVEYEFVLNVHDEVQVECDAGVADKVAAILEKAFDEVTAHLKFRIPLRGTAVIGDSWAQTH